MAENLFPLFHSPAHLVAAFPGDDFPDLEDREYGS